MKDVVRGGFERFETALTEVKGRALGALESASMDDVTVATKTTKSKVRIGTKPLSGFVPFLCILRVAFRESRDQDRKEAHGRGGKLQVLVEDRRKTCKHHLLEEGVESFGFLFSSSPSLSLSLVWAFDRRPDKVDETLFVLCGSTLGKRRRRRRGRIGRDDAVDNRVAERV